MFMSNIQQFIDLCIGIQVIDLYFNAYFDNIKEFHNSRRFSFFNFLIILIKPYVQTLVFENIVDPAKKMFSAEGISKEMDKCTQAWIKIGDYLVDLPATLTNSNVNDYKKKHAQHAQNTQQEQKKGHKTSAHQHHEKGHKTSTKQEPKKGQKTSAHKEHEKGHKTSGHPKNIEHYSELNDPNKPDVVEHMGGLFKGILNIGKFFSTIIKVAEGLSKLVTNPFGTMVFLIKLVIGVFIGIILLIIWGILSIPPFNYIIFGWYFFVFDIVLFSVMSMWYLSLFGENT